MLVLLRTTKIIETIQKVALKMILSERYISYESLLKLLHKQTDVRDSVRYLLPKTSKEKKDFCIGGEVTVTKSKKSNAEQTNLGLQCQHQIRSYFVSFIL